MSDNAAAPQLAFLDPPRPAPAPPSSPAPPGIVPREYRKGNWTLHETLVLITAKRLDDDRRATGGGGGGAPRSAEQRWKCVENYCWTNGCLRSQNQCNDKWDNLLRDYKKVRDYQSRSAAAGAATSYWKMERQEKKEKNLPTNLAPEVFDALTDILGRRAARRCGAAIPVSCLPPTAPAALPLPPPPANALPPPAPASTSPSISGDGAYSTGFSSSSSSATERSPPPPPPAKRRRLAASIIRGATVLARAMEACEEKRERRHREMLALEERRLRMEEERAEARRQGFAGLIAAVHGLSGAIHSLVAGSVHHRHHSHDCTGNNSIHAGGRDGGVNRQNR